LISKKLLVISSGLGLAELEELLISLKEEVKAAGLQEQK
jgi:hypothetical protein